MQETDKSRTTSGRTWTRAFVLTLILENRLHYLGTFSVEISLSPDFMTTFTLCYEMKCRNRLHSMIDICTM